MIYKKKNSADIYFIWNLPSFPTLQNTIQRMYLLSYDPNFRCTMNSSKKDKIFCCNPLSEKVGGTTPQKLNYFFTVIYNLYSSFLTRVFLIQFYSLFWWHMCIALEYNRNDPCRGNFNLTFFLFFILYIYIYISVKLDTMEWLLLIYMEKNKIQINVYW